MSKTPTPTGDMRISMIHPNLYNAALKRKGLDELIEIFDGEDGLRVKFEDDKLTHDKAINLIVDLVLESDLLKYMVVPSNVSRIREQVKELRHMSQCDNLAQSYGSLAEAKGVMEEIAETLERCADNLEAKD